jgi:hypothetical protein
MAEQSQQSQKAAQPDSSKQDPEKNPMVLAEETILNGLLTMPIAKFVPKQPAK